jgi:hypothetical protein
MEFPLRYKDPCKRALYTRAAMVFLSTGMLKAYANIKMFVKTEKREAGPDKAPRAIQPRTPEFNVGVGRFLKDFECTAVRAVKRIFHEPTITKGMNADQVGRILAGKFYSFHNPVAVGLDAVKFDEHCSQKILAFEHSLYNGVFKSGELKRYLQMQLTNHGVSHQGDKKLVYTVPGNRMSGDMNTGMGNCLLMCAMIWTYLNHYGIDAKLANNGDDCVLFLERGDLPRLVTLPAFFLRLGFNMTVEPPSHRLEDVEFCQCRVVEHQPGKFRAVRNPKNSIPKDLMTTKKLNVKEILYQRGAVAAGGLALAGDLPVLGAFYRWMDSGQRGARMDIGYGFRQLVGTLQVKYAEPSDTARASFALAFNVSPCEQLEIEAWFRRNPFDAGVADWSESWWANSF